MKSPISPIALFVSFIPLITSGLATADELPVLGPKPFIAYFQPISISNQFSRDIWGAAAVGTRDPSNGLEDRIWPTWT